MKAFTLITLLICSILFSPTVAHAIIAPKAPAEQKNAPQDARHARMEKRLDKVLHKMEKKIAKRSPNPYQIWEDGNFRLGVLLLLAGLGLGIIAALGILSGFFGFLAGLFALAGLIFIIWSLVEYA